MPATQAYTEQSLATYMHDALLQPSNASILGWTSTTVPGGNYDTIVNDTLQELGVADITTVTDVRLLELTAAKILWLAVLTYEFTLFDIGGGGQTRNLEREQVFQHARFMFQQAEANLEAYLLKSKDDGRRNPNGPISAVRNVRIVF
jgi:hypothetical protein